MSQTLKPAPVGAPAESSNRVKLGLSNRLLARPEVGAAFAAVIILIFFLVVGDAGAGGAEGPATGRTLLKEVGRSCSACAENRV
jgi:hypothetical protein